LLFNCILYRLPEGVSEQVDSVVFHNSAQQVVKDAIKHARFQTITYYHRNVFKQPMNARQVKALNLYLQKEYVWGIVDWLVKDAEAWDSLCEHWGTGQWTPPMLWGPPARGPPMPWGTPSMPCGPPAEGSGQV
jgi:hypothetical protein